MRTGAHRVYSILLGSKYNDPVSEIDKRGINVSLDCAVFDFGLEIRYTGSVS
jgi:hypothetical protein